MQLSSRVRFSHHRIRIFEVLPHDLITKTNKSMKTQVMGVLCLALAMVSCNEKKYKEVDEVVDETVVEENLQERGEYLVSIMDCIICHTPKKMTEQGPVPDMERYMMGFDSSLQLPPIPNNVPIGPWLLFSGDLTTFIGPWGKSYSANITPHATGIGAWTLEQFSKAIREGKYKGLDNSRPIMPPMPIEAFKNLSDKDVKAIFTYLKTIKPIENVVPAYQPPSS